MLKLMAVSIGALLLASCVTETRMILPDGSEGYQIRCGGAIRSIGDCYARAGEVCPAGYAIVGRDEEKTPMAYQGGSWGSRGGSFSGVAGSIVKRSLLVRCTPRSGQHVSWVTRLWEKSILGKSDDPLFDMVRRKVVEIDKQLVREGFTDRKERWQEFKYRLSGYLIMQQPWICEKKPDRCYKHRKWRDELPHRPS